MGQGNQQRFHACDGRPHANDKSDKIERFSRKTILKKIYIEWERGFS